MPAYAAIARAFSYLIQHSWNSGTLEGVVDVASSRSVEALRTSLHGVFAQVHRQHPGVHFWCKDEHSNFVAVCPLFLEASGLDEVELLSGINDADPRLPWARQAALYIRDDREVYDSQSAKLNILERQDRAGSTIWLKTSKAPYRAADGSGGGTVGGFAVISRAEALAESRARDRAGTAS